MQKGLPHQPTRPSRVSSIQSGSNTILKLRRTQPAHIQTDHRAAGRNRADRRRQLIPKRPHRDRIIFQNHRPVRAQRQQMALHRIVVTFTPQQPVAVEADEIRPNPPGQILRSAGPGSVGHHTHRYLWANHARSWAVAPDLNTVVT